jgi:class 3 adenylate cyclase/streptogramin lyase
MRGDELKPVPGGFRLATSAVEDAIPMEGGGALIATADRLFRMTATGIEDFPTSGDKYFAERTIYSMGVLPGGEIAIGTRTGGLVLLNSKGSVDRTLTRADGVPDSFVTSIYTDPQGGVWLGGFGGGITRFNPGLTAFDERAGIQGVFCSVRQDGVVYAGLKAGLVHMDARAGTPPRFYPVAGIESTVRSLIPYEGAVLAATDSGVYLAHGDKASPILRTSDVVYDVSVSVRDPSTVYAAGKNFVFKLHRNGADWQQTDAFAIPGQNVRTPLEDRDGKVWATTSDTIYRIDFRQQPAKAETFGADQGVPGRGLINAQRFHDRILFATSKGLLSYSEKAGRFIPDLSLGKEFADGTHDVLNIFNDYSGNVWVTGTGYHGILLKQPNGYKWVATPLLQSGISEIYGMSLDDDGTVWATGADGILFRWERDLAGNPDRNFSVLTRSVQTIEGENTLFGGAGKAQAIRLPYRSNAVRFNFAAPFYEEAGAVEYQTFLDGNDRAWSPWSHEFRRDSDNLHENSYILRVRARSPHGTVSDVATYAFSVLPPWYRTWWAYSLYAVFGALGVWGIVRSRVRQLEADKRRLEATVEERTIEIRQQRDEIQVQERKSHAMLLNILPSQVADELKATGVVKPVGFDDVTVCFTDFVGFTLSSEKLSPDLLVDALNEYFTAFDEIIARYGLEKLKTIGDSYMFASGLPARRDSHAVDAVLAAMEMAQVVKRLAGKTGGTGWNIRIGLHSGPVVAGVVGIRKFAFDIWGNTVNFAARMESSGVPGRVNMSERTCRLMRGLIDCEFRGQVRIKEGRELPMFLARQPVDDFAARYAAEFGHAPDSMPANVEEKDRSLNALVN